ncbi:M48 family metalloprotease [uncultured Sphingomonas sp.]|uniref:M48 family metallopeptidase n=1 Tax=uncultured Sphingomonas sp. TaxID=158754 RepID=UPI0035CAE2F8
MTIPAVFAMIASIIATQAAAPGFHEALRAADGRLAAIGYRLATSNVSLCNRLQPTTGVVVHGLAQYDVGGRDAARRTFGFETPVAVEAVVAGAPADRAGVRPDDALVAVGDVRVQAGEEGIVDRDRALDLLEGGDPAAPVALTLRRAGEDRTVVVTPTPACRARFELLLGRGSFAGSDGRVVHMGEGFFERHSDEEITVIVAHELAHVILRHPERLTAAKVDRGLLRELGRNGRIHRRTEREADELGVHLLANAGYDPASAARFWRERGGEIDAGPFRARTHPSSKARAEALDLVARSIAGRAKPTRPALLATRDEPLD